MRPPVAGPNDLRATAGTLVGRRLDVALEARQALWHPSADDGPALEVATFAEVGRAPSVPGPLLRVAAGDSVSITLVNRLRDTLFVTGLIDPRRSDTLVVAPGDTGRTRFRGETPGLYGYFGSTRRGAQRWSGGRGGQLTGVIVVDSVGARPDRIFAITAWVGAPPIGGDSTFLLAMNGKMWPHTERLQVAVGDSVHWRVINFAGSLHPMHLHGAYFRVDSRGTRTSDTAYTAAQQRLAVTELLGIAETMSITWSPQRAGRWLFHCHDAFHVDHSQERDMPVASRMWAASLRGDTTPLTAETHSDDMVHGMSGLVMGIDVSGPVGEQAAVDPRRIDLTVQQRERVFGDTIGIGFVLGPPGTIAADSIEIPGPPLVLRRDEAVAITVHNRLTIPTSVHWHGLELESYFDGVGGWSGSATRIAPDVAPGDSFVARFTPPRAGTFIYHSHFSEVRQLSLGLFGAMVVLEPGARWDAERDRVVLFAVAGVGDSALVVAHQSGAPMRGGVTYRLRFINITPADAIDVEAMQGGTTVQWRRVAKDGADLRAPARGPARLRFGPGETIDVEVTPRAGVGPLMLRTTTFNNFTLEIPVR
ncbi:MAG: multicopper oxidase domain-containing protein [Gemmatimonadaceae bacterium]|nr:multicopper oxidase domain-containing protein [Gemmatimonadaceae bacterium]